MSSAWRPQLGAPRIQTVQGSAEGDGPEAFGLHRDSQECVVARRGARGRDHTGVFDERRPLCRRDGAFGGQLEIQHNVGEERSGVRADAGRLRPHGPAERARAQVLLALPPQRMRAVDGSRTAIRPGTPLVGPRTSISGEGKRPMDAI